MLPFTVTLRPGEPIFDQVVYAVTRAAVTGQLRAGDTFPSVRALSLALKINPNTAHKIVAALTSDGLLEVRPGIGTVVTADEVAAAERPPGDHHGTVADAEAQVGTYPDARRALVQYHRERLAVERCVQERRDDRGVGVARHLARSEDVEEPERHGRNAVRAADHEAEAFLVELRQRVDRGERRRLHVQMAVELVDRQRQARPDLVREGEAFVGFAGGGVTTFWFLSVPFWFLLLAASALPALAGGA